jgi:hypothetical protein
MNPDWHDPDVERETRHLSCLAREFWATLDARPPKSHDWLAARGVSDDRALDAGGIGVARIETFRDGTYQPSEIGRPAFVLPCFDGPAPSPRDCVIQDRRVPPVIDLAAFCPRDPSRTWQRTGIATFLGQRAYDAARWHGWELRVYRDPMSWLRAGAELAGIVVLDWSAARLALRDVTMIAEDVDHARDLDCIMTAAVYPSPRILLEVA